MAKFRSIAKACKENIERQAQQEKLREKHSIEDANTVIVEKSNMEKFSVNTFIRLVKFFAAVIIVCLAVIGLTALMFPETREALLAIFHLAAEQTTEMINQ